MTSPVPRLGDRSLFPHLRPRWYLNHAAVHPVSTPVAAAVQAALQAGAEDGVPALMGWMDTAERTKASVAKLIGGDAEHIALLPNTSAGVTAVALGFPWVPGDRILLLDGEFPANITPWQRAAEAFDLRIETLPVSHFTGDGARGMEALDALLKDGLRLVALSAVQFQTGLRMPWEAMSRLARSYGAATFVDAIQAAGVVPMDVSSSAVDFVAAGSHKWLGGTPGTGFLWAHPDRWAELRPLAASWLSHEEPLEFLFAPGLLRYDKPLQVGPALLEGGMINALPIAALGASVDLILSLGVPNIFEHVRTYADALAARLEPLGMRCLRDPHPDRQTGSLCYRVDDAAAISAELGEAGAAVSTPDGALRFAPHWPNGLHEVDEFAEALAKVIRARG